MKEIFYILHDDLELVVYKKEDSKWCVLDLAGEWIPCKPKIPKEKMTAY